MFERHKNMTASVTILFPTNSIHSSVALNEINLTENLTHGIINQNLNCKGSKTTDLDKISINILFL